MVAGGGLPDSMLCEKSSLTSVQSEHARGLLRDMFVARSEVDSFRWRTGVDPSVIRRLWR